MNFKSIFCFLSLIVLYGLNNPVFSQGCSDAGLCTAGSMKHDNTNDSRNTLTLNNQLGSGEQGVSIFSTQLEYRRIIKHKWAVQVKLPWVFTTGNLGSFNGFGDITLVGSYLNLIDKAWKMNVNLGFKLPTGTTNAAFTSSLSRYNPYTLPMPYQTGLGTFDLLLGADIRNEKGWLFAAGIQIPMIQNNKNLFDTGAAAFHKDASAYFVSSQLIRQPDAVARIERQFKLSGKSNIQVGFVPIYHLGNDKYIPVLGEQKIITLEGSRGLTLNFGGGYQYQISEHFGLSAKFASPLMVRKVRPDGLTRAYVAGFEITYKF